MRNVSFVIAAIVALSALASALDVRAQEEPGITVAAAALTNPRGLAWGPEGELIVAQAGVGGTVPASEGNEVPAPTGPYLGGPTASVVSVRNGCVSPIASDLPSAVSATGDVVGIADVAYLGDTLYSLVSGGGDAHGNPIQPNGVYRHAADADPELVVDLGQWLRDNPVANPPTADFDPDGSFFAMVPAADDAALVVVESNSEQVLRVTPDGEVTRLADLSGDDQVPTAVTLGADGAVLVGQLTSTPFPAGGASVLRLDPSGEITTVWTGLTAITGMAVGVDGTLYAAQMAETRDRPPFFQLTSGSIVRQTGESSSEPVVTGLDLPVSLRTGPDGALYVSLPAIGGAGATGQVLRIVPGDAPLVGATGDLREPECGDGTAGAPSDDEAEGEDAGDGTGGVDPTPPAPAAGGDAATSEIIIRLFEFGVDPATLTVPVGTTVIWANTGAVEHTVTGTGDGPAWDSGPIPPGGTFAFTFNDPGTWTYVCSFHPEMTGTIVVE